MFISIILVCQLALTLASPFHKYPFVFLLDIGNEELQNTSTEQIRLSAPGGSIALRYPATQGGDTIVHVRVSGIDFGTDLKANIVEGGPGYNYVVLSFVGNPNVAYDAVISVQTLPSDSFIQDNTVSNMSEGNDNEYQNTNVEDNKYTKQKETNSDANVVNDYRSYKSKKYDENTDEQSVNNGEAQNYDEDANQRKEDVLTRQPSENVYDYAQNELENDDSSEDEGETTKEKDNQITDYNSGYEEENNAEESQDTPKAERYVSNGYVSDESYDGEEPVIVDNNLYSKYDALKSHFNGDEKLLPQQAVDEAQSNGDEDVEGDDDKTDLTEEDPVELDQMFNDEEVHNDADKFKDSNNNDFDSEDASGSAVAS